MTLHYYYFLAAKLLRKCIPAQFFNKVCSIFSNFPREFDGIDAFQDNVVCLHGILPRERWTVKQD